MADELLLSVRDLVVEFETEDGVVHAVNGVSFDVRSGDVLAIVGESGSGKSVSALSMLGLLPRSGKVRQGVVLWKGEDLLEANAKRLRSIRGNEIAMIFQDPLTALNPVLTVGRQIGEVVEIHRGMNRKEARRHAIDMLDLVGLPEPHRRVDMYPHELSGGMRQRVMIAMAIACQPALLIADEPTTALDVTVQGQILDVLVEIKRQLGSAIILITHDLAVVAGLATSVLVMYAGHQVEVGSVDEVFYRPAHPYTIGILRSIPKLEGDHPTRLSPIGGQPPSMIKLPNGCTFHPRCAWAQVPEPCAVSAPKMEAVEGSAHEVSCHFSEAVRAGFESEK